MSNTLVLHTFLKPFLFQFKGSPKLSGLNKTLTLHQISKFYFFYFYIYILTGFHSNLQQCEGGMRTGWLLCDQINMQIKINNLYYNLYNYTGNKRQVIKANTYSLITNNISWSRNKVKIQPTGTWFHDCGTVHSVWKLNEVVSVLATWWPPAPIRVARKQQTGNKCSFSPLVWERQREGEGEKRKLSLGPFLDIVDNHNNRDKFHRTLHCLLACSRVCLSEQAPIGGVFICLVMWETKAEQEEE